MGRNIFEALRHTCSHDGNGSASSSAMVGHVEDGAKDTTGDILLKVEDVSVRYGVIEAVRHVSLRLHQGGVVAVLGANGAGKSSLGKVLAGLIACEQGSISYMGRDISRTRPEARVAFGLALVPEGRGLLGNLTVRENLILGLYAVWRGRSAKLARIEEILTLFPRLRPLLDRRAGVLSGGELQLVAIARAIMADPSLVIMDEPTMGLAPRAVAEVADVVSQLRTGGTGVLLLEQNATVGLATAEYVYVMDHGEVVWHGTSEEAAARSDIVNAYLGIA